MRCWGTDGELRSWSHPASPQPLARGVNCEHGLRETVVQFARLDAARDVKGQPFLRAPLRVILESVQDFPKFFDGFRLRHVFSLSCVQSKFRRVQMFSFFSPTCTPTVEVRSARDRFAPVRSAPVRSASVRSALYRYASVRSALYMYAPVRSALYRYARDRFASVRSAPARSAPCRTASARFALYRYASVRSALYRYAPVRSALYRYARDRFASVRSAPARSAPARFARDPVALSAHHRLCAAKIAAISEFCILCSCVRDSQTVARVRVIEQCQCRASNNLNAASWRLIKLFAPSLSVQVAPLPLRVMNTRNTSPLVSVMV